MKHCLRRFAASRQGGVRRAGPAASVTDTSVHCTAGVDHARTDLRRGGDQCGAYRFPVQPRGRVHQSAARIDRTTFSPQRFAVSGNPVSQIDATLAEALSGPGASETEDFPSDVARVRAEASLRNRCSASAPSNMIVSCGSHSMLPSTSKRSFWLAQEPAERYHLPAPGVVSSTAASEPSVYMQRQLIATDESRRRMNDDRMTDRVAFRIQRLLHDQRALEALLEENCFSLFGLEPKRQVRPSMERRLARRHASRAYGHTASSRRTSSRSMSAPAPRATISPRSITRYWSASERAKS